MSEKLFDSLFAAAFPIYVGPNPVNFGMPQFVAIHPNPDFNSRMKSIQQARTIDLDTWRESVLTRLESEGLQEAWSGPFVTQQILDKIDENLV